MSSKLIFGKFEGAGFRNKNGFYEILVQKYANKVFLVPNLGIFILVQNVTVK